MPKFSYGELAECAEREVKQRERVYKRLIENGSMSRPFAQKQRLMMRAIADHFNELARDEPSQPDFVGG